MNTGDLVVFKKDYGAAKKGDIAYYSHHARTSGYYGPIIILDDQLLKDAMESRKETSVKTYLQNYISERVDDFTEIHSLTSLAPNAEDIISFLELKDKISKLETELLESRELLNAFDKR